MPNLNDFHAFKSTSGGSGGGGFGCGWVVIILVVYMLIFFIIDGVGWDAIDTLLGLGFLAFLFAKSLF